MSRSTVRRAGRPKPHSLTPAEIAELRADIAMAERISREIGTDLLERLAGLKIKPLGVCDE